MYSFTSWLLCYVQVKTDSNRLLKFIGCECLKELEMAYPVSKCVWKLHGYISLYPSKVDTNGTTTECLGYGGNRNSVASGVFPVGLVMCTRAARTLRPHLLCYLMMYDETD